MNLSKEIADLYNDTSGEGLDFLPEAQPYDEQTEYNFNKIMDEYGYDEKVKKRKRKYDDKEESSSKRVKGEMSDNKKEESPFYEERLTSSDDDEIPSHEEQIKDKIAEIKNIKEMIEIHKIDMNSGNKDYGKSNNKRLMEQYNKTLSILEEELKELKEKKSTYGGRKHTKTVKKKSYKVKKGKTAKKSNKGKKSKKGKSKKKGGMHHKKTMKKKKGGKKGKKEKSKKSRK